MSGFCKRPSSNLHIQLISKLNDLDLANRIYSFIQTDEFYKLHGDDIIFDENGEPTIESILPLLNVSKLTDDTLKQQLQEELNKNIPVENVKVVERAVDFNRQNKKFYATVKDLNSGKSQIVVKKRTPECEAKVSNLEKNLKIFNTIDKFLQKLGIDIKILDASYFNGEDALMIPSNLNKQAKGIWGVVNLANNFAGFQALPEEFGHFLIECLKTNPIIQRCESYLAQHLELCKEVLGEEFEKVKNYYINKKCPELLYREVLGRIIARYLNSDAIDSDTLLKRGEKAVKQFIEKTFKINSEEQKQAFDDIFNLLNTVMDDFVSTVNKSNYYTSEMQAIKANAIRAGTFMKAPNGNPTNLTERQWLQVRTKAFKDWFGDWENDPENASKVVDENGEPLVVYHGTKNGNFNAFDYEHLKKADSGFFFSSDKEYAKQFGDTRAFFLNIKNPNKTNIPLNLNSVKDLLTTDYINGTDGIIGNDDKNTNENINSSNGQEYVALRPNQIKSATGNVGTFSKTDDSIFNDDGKTQEISNILDNFSRKGDTLAHTHANFDNSLKKLESSLLSNVQKYMQIYKRTNPILVESLKSIFGDEVDRKNKQNVWINQYRELLKNANISDEDFQTVCDEFVTLTYLKDTFEKSTNLLKTLKENFDNLYNETKDQFDFEVVTRNASTIRELKNFLLIYQEQLNELRNVATYIAKRNLQVDVNQNLLNEVLSVANQLEQNIRNIDDELAIAKKQTVTNFCMPFFNENGGDTITVAGTSISKEKVIELSHILEFIDGDIGSIKMVLDTAYNSPDLLTQIISTAIKSQQEKIRIQTLTDVEELNGLFAKYDVRDTNFMHERDRFGNITGYYVNKYGIDFQKYEIEHRKAMEAIDNRNDWNSSQKKNAKHQWYIDHTRPIHLDMYIQNQDTGLWEVDPDPNHKEIITIPKNDTLWNSDAYNKLSDKQKKLCDAFLEYKHKMDYVNGLRGSKRYFKCVQKMISGVVESAMSPQRGILKNLLKNKVQVTDEDLEYGSNASGTDTMTLEEEKSFWRKIKNKLRNLLHPSDEKQIVDARKTLTDFEHNVYMKVPLNYVEDLDDINMLSTNVYDSLLNYTAATYQHVGMCEIADIAALTLDIANNRKVLQYNASGQQLVDQNNNPVHKNSYGSNVNNQLEFIIRSQIYSAKKKPGATILNGKLSVSKLTDGILRLTSIGLLGYNPFTAINNVLVGKSQMFIEALGKKNMSISNLAKANLEYHKLLFDGGLGGLNAVSKDSMLYLLTKTFNPEKDWFQQEIKKDVYKPATLRLMEKLGPSFMMAAGESNLKYTGLIAMLMSTPMKDNNGKVTNLYDSLTVVTKEKNGIKYKELAIKEGYTKPDGKKFTFYSKNGRSDLQKFNDKMTIANHKMHGIYDTEDYIMLKQWEAGRMLMLFRNFMAPFFTKRWKNIKNVFRGEQTFNLQLGSSDDGVYTTAFKFIKQLISPNTELLDESGHLKSRFSVLYHGLNETEKSNFWNFIGEMVATMLVSMLLLFVFRDWDDDEDVWIARANGYFLRRLQTELTYGWSVKSLTEILQSPTAVMGPFNDIMRVIKSIGDDHILQSGPYKGKTRFRANVERAFPIIPNIKDFVNIDTEDKRFKVFEDSFFYKKSEEKEEND